MAFGVAYCGTIEIYSILINFIIGYFLPLQCCGLILVYLDDIIGIVSATIVSRYLRLRCGLEFKIPRLTCTGGFKLKTTGVTTAKIQAPNEKLPFSVTAVLQDIRITFPLFWLPALFQGCEVKADGVTILLEKQEQNQLDSSQEWTDTIKELLCPYDKDYRNGSDAEILTFIENVLCAVKIHIEDIKVILLSHTGTCSVATELCLKSVDTIQDSVLKHLVLKGLSINTFQHAGEDGKFPDICSLLEDTEETVVSVGKALQDQEIHVRLHREPEFKETDGSQIRYLDLILSFFFIGKVDVQAQDNKPMPKQLHWNVSCDALLFFLPPEQLRILLQCVGFLMGIRSSPNCSQSMLHGVSAAFGSICIVVPLNDDDDLQNANNSEVSPRSLSSKRRAEKFFEAFMKSGVDFANVSELRKTRSSLYPDHFRFPETEICGNALILQLSRGSFSTVLDGNGWEEIEVQYNNFQGFLMELPESDPMPFIQVSVDPRIDELAKDNGVDWPRIVISNQCHKSLLEEQSSSIPDLLSNRKPSPFSNSSFCGSTTLPDEENDGCETEIVVPSSKENICDFIDETVNKSWYVVKLDLQNCTLFLREKHLLELLYSSFKDVMQWKMSAIPTADSDLEDSEKFSLHVPLPDMSCHASKGHGYLETLEDYINGSSDDENKDSLGQKLNQEEDRTELSVIANIQRGAIVIHNPLRNGSKKLALERGGRMVFQVQDCKVFTAPSYNGNLNEAYLCVLSNKVSLHHNGYVSLPNVLCDLEALRNVENLQPVICNSETGILAHNGPSFRAGRDGLDMLSVSVHATSNVQEMVFKMAVQLQAATLKYCPSDPSEAWQTQLMSFISVSDSSGNHCAASSVSDLNVHLEHCAVDYRPRYLPLHVVITAKSLDLPKVQISTCAPQRMIGEEICLYLSDNTAMDFVDLRNYVCVVQTGLFEVSLTATGAPQIKLLASNDIVNVRTCVDSCQALLALIKYIACNGDFPVDPCSTDKQVCLDREPVLQNVAPDLESLIQEAMECHVVSDCPSRSGTKHDYAEINLGIAEEFYGSIDDIDDELKWFPTRDAFKAPQNFPVLFHYLIQSSIVWKIYDGNDFPVSEENGSLNSSYCSSRFPDEMLQEIRDSSTTIGDDELFFTIENESFISVGNESVTCSWKERGGKNRNHKYAVEFHLTKVQVQREVYSEGPYASRDVLTLRNIEILDGLVTSDINKFLYSHESNEHMLVVQAVYSHPHAGQHSEECDLEVSAKSLRLNIDQDTLVFILSFFKKAFDSSAGMNPPESPEYRQHSERPVHTTSESSMSPTFFKSFTFTEEVVIRLDYTGKRIAFNSGVISGIMMGLAELNGSEIKLKRLFSNIGLLGSRKLINHVLSCWSKDIRQNQIAGLLCGIGPMDPVIRLITGIKDLVWLPVEEVRNKGHLVTGLKRGAASFLSKSPAAALELTSKAMQLTETRRYVPSALNFCFGVSQFFIPQGLWDAAILACETITPGPRRGGQRVRNHPSDIRDGMSEAWKTMREGVCNSAKTVAKLAAQEHKHKGLHAAFGSLVREVPNACLNTVISGAEASQIVLESARNHLSPKICREMRNKYKKDNKQGRTL